ncbi:diacylglycerol/lipid kinase family protein [Miltoncostaea marina]|uniref:diacylglycerol/lipid kinase family protein n=1 Tax=Miltoncostaea marina TaxID=2843215 RepID=UPI001C3D4E80|nr:diacylglycerol kinase family protein [Miltoncostaea marina]
MRVLLLVKESSGSGSGPDGDALARAMRDAGAEVDLRGAEEIDAIAATRPDRVVIASGDGNVAHVADAAGAAGVPLGVIPNGTANDFAGRMGIPADVLEAARLAATGERLRTIDLARVGDHPFVNMATAGLAVAALRGAEPLKPLIGPAGYLVGAVRAGLTGRPVTCDVRCDGRRLYAGRAWQVMVACSGAFGAGSRVAEADPSDGLLDVVVLAAGGRLRLVRHAYGLRRGRITEQPGVVGARARRVELGLPPGAELNVDGDVEDAGPPLTVEPGRVRVVVG